MSTPLTDTMLHVVARRFRLLGEPMRLRILQLLRPGALSVNSIVEQLGTSQPNVSKHLQALAQGGLIRRRRDGLNTFYAIADPTIFSLCDLVCHSATQQTRALLEGMRGIPVPTKKRGRQTPAFTR
ncbi:MAG TPA: metalloregulator ArsR/SmtB family transcription factor [Candidatus Limnocylindrales bacterium]|nr:metalloregulator ArsR/SmtB family transcription factor [Candidatus Limnocylindrales bacterium]